MTCGATVFVIVAAEMHGEFLHRLEYEADIFVIEVAYDRSRHLLRWSLRSDRFPSEWEGRVVECVAATDSPGIIEFCVRAAV